MMIRKVLFAALLPIAACETALTQESALPPEAMAPPSVEDGVYPSMMRVTGSLIDGSGSQIGSVNMLGGPNGVLMEVTVAEGGLEPGWHGLHLHQVGNCDDLGVFKNSGGHVGMIANGHGLLNPAGPEAGDLPNIWAGADGSAGYEAFSQLFTLSDIVDEDGGTLIIHAERDDHLSQPIGGAGARVACAVLQ
ncbi:MAG: hypothetical protein Hens3KO_22160 [Henriciella sp.]